MLLTLMNIFVPLRYNMFEMIPVFAILVLYFSVDTQNIENVFDVLRFLPALLTLQNMTEKVK